MATTRYDARRILLNWQVGKVIALRGIESGVVNQNWLVKDTKGEFILRRLTFATLEDLRFELNYLRYLRTYNFPYKIPSPLPTADGHAFVRFTGAFFWLYQYIEGRVKAKLGKKEIRQVAKMMATYHNLIGKSKLS